MNTANDVKNCGSCGHACPSGAGVASAACVASKCQLTCAAGYSLCFGQCVQGANCSVAAPFSTSEMDTMIGYFESNLNVQGDGGVMASPSQSDPNYYFHWQRDGAISMREYMVAKKTLTAYTANMQSYIKWVHGTQFASDPNNIDVRGEPKFFLGFGGTMGDVYNKPWMRPQNDGCALRSIAAMLFAKQLLAAGQKQYVAENIWTGTPDKPGVQRDLQYVVQVWPDDSGDPWEEVRGQVFFDKFAMRLALLMGAELATEFGNTTAATLYTSTAKAIEANILSVHWNPSQGIIMEVPNIRPLDSATHLGVLYGYAGDGFLACSSEKVQSSVGVLVSSFASYSLFQVNAADSAAGLPGLLVGRYLNDHYNGGNPSQPSDGNPWVLCTASLADVYYRAAAEHAAAGAVAFTDLNARFFTQVMDFAAGTRGWRLQQQQQQQQQQTGATAAPAVPAGAFAAASKLDAELRAAIAGRMTLSQDDEATSQLFARLLASVVLSGDGILLRLRHHVEPLDFHLPEELNKDTGASQGAHDLTWSYGTVIGAMNSRANAVADVLPRVFEAVGMSMHDTLLV